jgi:hypothetical protein
MPKWLHWPEMFNTDLVDNLPPITTTSQGYFINFNQWLRIAFTTGNNSNGYIINSVILRLSELTANPNLVVRLYNDSSGTIGGQIAQFVNPVFIPNTTRNYVFTLTNPQILAANTTYWLVVGILSGSGQYMWAFTTSGNQSGSLGWSIRDDSLYTSNQGGSWQFFPGTVVFQFKVTGATL